LSQVEKEALERYGETIIESKLRESINKGWNSIEVSKYEKFNHIENDTI
tara:strand:+ start:331 stop:477 length:147 start_codon:yes stop_codon:yes gene_type:complete